ncbi:receptor-binding cancer antigen expressed on SiSo cells-like [Asterias amurensis]|uniref:receptor-binding cancer antigen expressed on SiSo cells-like n=1 Tax=Asterias amurensis TaxID=7602 RepID=UPI003AB84225
MAAFRCNKWFLCNFLASVFVFLKRILFSRFHRGSKSDIDLPKHSSNISTPSAANSPNDHGQDVADWDDWDYAGAPTSIVVEPNDPNLAQQQVDLNQPAEDIPEMDYFSDMAPTMKRTVLIRKKDRGRGGLPNSGISNRLSMNVDVTPMASSELSTWDDNEGTWEDEAGAIDLSWDADRVIKEKKQAERDKRAAEQHRKKMEREAQRAVKKDTSKLAVKLK